MTNGKNGKKKKDVDFLEGLDLSFSDATGSGKKNMGFGDMGMPDVKIPDINMDFGPKTKSKSRPKSKKSKTEYRLHQGKLYPVHKPKGKSKPKRKSSRDDFGDFSGILGPKIRSASGTSKPLFTIKKDKRTPTERKVGLPRGYKKTLQEAKEEGVGPYRDFKKEAQVIQAKEDYDKLKEYRKEQRRNSPIRRGIRKSHQKLKDYGEEKPPKPKSNGNSTAKPTQKQLPIPSKWRIVIEKDGQQRAHWFDTLNDAQSAKAGYVANGYRLVSMSKHSI